jgi:drug/metabolite transporter (DMT)-like permease
VITRLSLAALVIASLFWGTAVSVTKYALRGFGPITLLAISLIAGTVMLWTIVILRGHRPPPSWRRAVLLGLFEPALAYAGDLLGLARTSAANGALLSGLESVFIVLLAAIFLRERITGRIAMALALALAGVMALEGTGSFSGAGLGDLLVLAGVLSAAAYTIVARGMGDESDPLTVTACQFAAATFLVLPAVTGVGDARRNPAQPRGREILARRNPRGSHRLRRQLPVLQLRHRPGASCPREHHRQSHSRLRAGQCRPLAGRLTYRRPDSRRNPDRTVGNDLHRR